MSTVANLPHRTVPSKILVVDDDDLQLSLMADWLSTSGFSVSTAADGEQALNLLKQEWFPIVVSDWHMPVMSGIQLAEHLRDSGGDSSYFIMLSARADRTDLERGYAAGVDDYLTKKSLDPELLARINAGLQTVELRRRLRNTRRSLDNEQLLYEAAQLTLRSRLQTEIARARRYQRPCTLSMLNVSRLAFIDFSSKALLDIVQNAIRTDIDWADYYEVGVQRDAHPNALALVLPETTPKSAGTVIARVKSALEHQFRQWSGGDTTLHFGFESVELDIADYRHASAETVLATANAQLNWQLA